MPTQDKPDAAAVVASLRALDRQTVSQMQDFADAQAARAARLSAVKERLSKKLGHAHPRVAAITNSVKSSSDLAGEYKSLALRMARRPSVNSADLAVVGQVLDSTGTPMPLLFVRLSNQNGSLTLGPRVETDDTGDFTLALKSCEILAPAPDLFVLVEDAKGARVAMSEQPVTLQAGSPLYIEIVLGSGPKAQPKDEAPVPAAPDSKGPSAA